MRPRLSPHREALRRRGFWAWERVRWPLSNRLLALCLWLEEGVARRVGRHGTRTWWVDVVALSLANGCERAADWLVPEFAAPAAPATKIVRPRVPRAPDEHGPGDLEFINLPEGFIAEYLLHEAGMTHELTI